MRTHYIPSADLKGTVHTQCGHYGEPIEKVPGQYRLLAEGDETKFFWAKGESWNGVDCKKCLKQKRS